MLARYSTHIPVTHVCVCVWCFHFEVLIHILKTLRKERFILLYLSSVIRSMLNRIQRLYFHMNSICVSISFG